jgi:hypothetical protein
MNCLSKDCKKGAVRTFKILNLRNRFNSKSFTGTLTISSVDDEDYIFDSSSTSISSQSLASILLPGISG